ncbi:MAG: FtsX-like permease family protein [Proteobacteria bacterium]|nr:FtsX-like permease family protein [Pseudomonadota bacterium]
MMPAKNLVKMVVGNTLRSRRHFILSAFGIVIGIATFVLFLASTEQVGAVLERIFPVEEVEVVAPQVSLLGKDISKRLDDTLVQTIKTRPEAKRVLPRMSLQFPAYGDGTFNGSHLSLEIGGAADGIDPSYVVDDAALSAKEHEFFADVFKDWESDPTPRTACVPPGPKDPNPCPRTDRYYCDKVDRQCHHRVPVVLSPTMLELYNTQFAKSHGTPVIDQDFAKFIIQQGGMERMRFTLALGVSVFGSASAAGKSREVEATVIGISSKAKKIGMTVPLAYISRWNTEFVSRDAGKTYSSIVVTLAQREQLAVFAQWLQDKLDLRLEDSLGEKFATVVFVIRLVLVIISLVIIGISSINIAHNFFMQVTERRRELGLLRAVGATQTDVQLVVMGEAGLIGVIGGVLGILCGWLLSLAVDGLSNHYVPNFPFKPTTWFHFQWWILLGGLACATFFSVIGGYLPARKAARMQPAAALAAQ